MLILWIFQTCKEFYFKKIKIMLLKKLILFSYLDKLEQLNHEKDKIHSIVTNYYQTYLGYNILLKIVILIFFILVVFINIFFVIINLYKLKFNYFSKAANFISRFPFLKNINNFIKANLFLHIQ